ncbi:hypothetical protein M8C21_006130 [Ambrosia artemisiifolia]|uniref:Uncharacterized protein n=1 Tax=Ambrosia artemisiifolia TaxID=4212 RepID=A0AAD5BQS5_AMBAR|nr:hypothetical protein M8C21_006130 [Ambrosia artemisiifolia]
MTPDQFKVEILGWDSPSGCYSTSDSDSDDGRGPVHIVYRYGVSYQLADHEKDAKVKVLPLTVQPPIKRQSDRVIDTKQEEDAVKRQKTGLPVKPEPLNEEESHEAFSKKLSPGRCDLASSLQLLSIVSSSSCGAFDYLK